MPRPPLGPVAQRLEPTAHNGLVGGSSPPGPTLFNDLSGALVFDRSRMFAFSSRISLVNRWSNWEAPRSLDRWCRRILGLHSIPRTARAIARPLALGHNALTAEGISVLEEQPSRRARIA